VKMKRTFRSIAIVCVVALCLAVVAVFVGLPVAARLGVFDSLVARKLSEAIGTRVTIEGVEVSVVRGATIRGVQTRGSDEAGLAISCPRIEVRGNLLKLLRGRADNVSVVRPRIAVDRSVLAMASRGGAGGSGGVQGIYVTEGTLIVDLGPDVIEARSIRLSLSRSRGDGSTKFDLSAVGDWGELAAHGLVDGPAVACRFIEWTHADAGRLAGRCIFNLKTREIGGLSVEQSEVDLGALTAALPFVDWPVTLAGKVTVRSAAHDRDGYSVETTLSGAQLGRKGGGFAFNQLTGDMRFLVKRFGKETVVDMTSNALDVVIDVSGTAISTHAEGFETALTVAGDVLATKTVLGRSQWRLKGNTLTTGRVVIDERLDHAQRVMTLGVTAEGAALETAQFSGFENMGASISCEFRFEEGFAKAHVKAAVEASGFQYAWGPITGDYGGERASFAGEGDVAFSPTRFRNWQGDLRVAEYLAARIRDGQFTREDGRTSFALIAGVERLGLARAFEEFVRSPFGEVRPFLGRAQVSGTASSPDLACRFGADGWSVRGMVSPSDASFASGAVSVEGVGGTFPLDLSQEGSGEPMKGEVTIGQASVGPLKLRNERLRIETRAGGIAAPQEVLLASPGGELSLTELVWGWRGEADQVRFALDIEGIDLEQLTQALAPNYAFGGTLSGHFDEVVYRDDVLATSGSATAQVFGGTIALSEMGGASLLSDVRSWQFSARLSHIDMGAVADLFDAGTISGILEGEIRDFEIAAGRPNAWQIDVETVKAKGFKQTVSIDFVSNLQYFTSGTLMQPLEESVRRRTLYYEEFGFVSRMKNDYVHIAGKFHENGKEYFMRKPFLRDGINIVNGNPGVVHSFRDVFERVHGIIKGKVKPTVEVE